MPKTTRPASQARLDFGRRVRELRHEKGLTLEDVAELADMNWSYIAQVERGVRNLSLDNAAALADALELPLWQLLRPLKKKPQPPTEKPDA